MQLVADSKRKYPEPGAVPWLVERFSHSTQATLGGRRADQLDREFSAPAPGAGWPRPIYLRGARAKYWCPACTRMIFRVVRSITLTVPRWTSMIVPSQRSIVVHMVPRTVPDA
jgi:hypothetical protein